MFKAAHVDTNNFVSIPLLDCALPIYDSGLVSLGDIKFLIEKISVDPLHNFYFDNKVLADSRLTFLKDGNIIFCQINDLIPLLKIIGVAVEKLIDEIQKCVFLDFPKGKISSFNLNIVLVSVFLTPVSPVEFKIYKASNFGFFIHDKFFFEPANLANILNTNYTVEDRSNLFAKSIVENAGVISNFGHFCRLDRLLLALNSYIDSLDIGSGSLSCAVEFRNWATDKLSPLALEEKPILKKDEITSKTTAKLLEELARRVDLDPNDLSAAIIETRKKLFERKQDLLRSELCV